ncbi:type I-F CRISPR-associated protein Csy1 [Melaminivora jejuensis]|uniref:type I-F CRISPR-associated protein Csy1 n=1 Tax=Melaminivora jejuensis TaxID=1267217 RepID=UPI001E40E476|nr:type I-F CRISPR-associated protein Csy1 [Melaminivora jejuensis]UHJ64901.1 type I-F CRISPR-associated protein Csy1 [Melaminivora jejuensis]
MTDDPEQPGGHASYRAAIAAFLQERLQGKLDKLKDYAGREELLSQHQPSNWIADAAKRVSQIQAVTHSLKPIHPDARGTNLYVEPVTLPQRLELGSHALGERFAGDVVGNAAALDVYKFLRLEVNGRSLLAALMAEDTEALAALHSDAKQAQALRDAFVALTLPRTGGSASHTLAKQLYWLIGTDACTDGAYTLLAPLYATSLAHAVHAQIQEDRFGAANKAARIARKERRWHDGEFHDYPALAVQNMGGTKPQNISQLNSERRGMNYLLSSLPPQWRPDGLRLPVNADSIFQRLFGARPAVRQALRALRQLLESDPVANQRTRQQRDEWVSVLLGELVAMAAELEQALPPGWSTETRFADLSREEKLWLDPLRAELPEEEEFAQEWLAMDWPDAIGKRFGNWLNAQLEGQLHLGDIELRAWKHELLTDEDGFTQQLRERRSHIRAARKEAQV